MVALGIGEKLVIIGLVDILIFKFFTILQSLFIVAAIFLAIFWYIKKTLKVLQKLGIPHEKPSLIVGNYLQIAKKGILQHDLEMSEKYGKIYGEYMFLQPSISIVDAGLYRNILVKDFNNFQNRIKLRSEAEEEERRKSGAGGLASNNIALLTGEHWKNVRSTLTPAFTSAKLKQMVPLIHECVETILEVMNEKAKSRESFDVKNLMSGYAMNVIGSVAFGTKIDSIRNPEEPICANAKKILEKRGFRSPRLLFFLFFPWLTSFLQKYFGMKSTTAQNETEEFFTEILTKIIESRKGNPRNPPDFLQLMLNSREEEGGDFAEASKEIEIIGKKVALTQHEIMSQCFLFLLGGFETTSTALTFIFYTLATNPEIQNRCVEEIKENIENIANPTYDEVTSKLPYLDAVIHETLRMYPPAPRFNRFCDSDYNLGGIKIPKGSLVNIPVYNVHHSADYYPEPEKFDPERFFPEAKANRDPYTFLPFGFGPRNCIGMRFALLEMKIFLAGILPKFEIFKISETEIPIKLTSITTLKPVTPIKLALEIRN